MIFRAQDRCKRCVNYTQEQTCKAFPEGIPEALLSGDVYHDHAIEGDGGYRFEPKRMVFPDADTFLSGDY